MERPPDAALERRPNPVLFPSPGGPPGCGDHPSACLGVECLLYQRSIALTRIGDSRIGKSLNRYGLSIEEPDRWAGRWRLRDWIWRRRGSAARPRLKRMERRRVGFWRWRSFSKVWTVRARPGFAGWIGRPCGTECIATMMKVWP